MIRPIRTCPQAAHVRDGERHQAAVARSLGWAQESAARGDYADALAWVEVVEAIGDSVPHEYEVNRWAWLAAAGRGSDVKSEV